MIILDFLIRKLMKIKFLIFTLALFMLNYMSYGQMEKSQYKIAKKISLKNDGFWDYLTMDEASGYHAIRNNNKNILYAFSESIRIIISKTIFY